MTPEEKKEQEKQYQKAYKLANKEKIAEQGRKYREKNKEKIAAKKHADHVKNYVPKPKPPKDETPRHKQKKRAEYMCRYREEKKKQIAITTAKYGKKYRAENKELLQEKHKKYQAKYVANGTVKERSRIWRDANREFYQQKMKEYYAQNKDKILERLKQYTEENKEYIRERQKAWSKRTGKNRLYSSKRRARERNAGGKLSKDLVPRLMQLQKGKCRACGKPLGEDYHIDHIMPLAKGGPNVDSNCQLLHSRCNISKGARDPYEHAQRLGMLFI